MIAITYHFFVQMPRNLLVWEWLNFNWGILNFDEETRPPCNLSTGSNSQRWSRGHKARGQGHKKNPRPRPRTAFPRTDTLEAKDKNARGQGQGPKTQAQVLSKKKRSSQKFFWRSPPKNVFQTIFQALHKILTIQKNSAVLEPRTGQFSRTWGLETKDLTFEAKDFKMCPRGLHLC